MPPIQMIPAAIKTSGSSDCHNCSLDTGILPFPTVLAAYLFLAITLDVSCDIELGETEQKEDQNTIGVTWPLQSRKIVFRWLRTTDGRVQTEQNYAKKSSCDGAVLEGIFTTFQLISRFSPWYYVLMYSTCKVIQRNLDFSWPQKGNPKQLDIFDIGLSGLQLCLSKTRNYTHLQKGMKMNSIILTILWQKTTEESVRKLTFVTCYFGLALNRTHWNMVWRCTVKLLKLIIQQTSSLFCIEQSKYHMENTACNHAIKTCIRTYRKSINQGNMANINSNTYLQCYCICNSIFF